MNAILRLAIFVSLLFLVCVNNLFAQADHLYVIKYSSKLSDKTYPDSINQRDYGKIISLSGKWDIAEGNMSQIPRKYPFQITVPGLVNNKETKFSQIGLESKKREAFWYKKKFKINGDIPEVARLKIFKAMFGSKVFINGKVVGDNPLNFTPGYFNIKPFLKGNNEWNEIIVRVGAFINQVPDTVLNGGDAEKHRYVPGIYDKVEIILSNSPYVLRAQVAPDVIKKEITVQIQATSVFSDKQNLPLNMQIREFDTGNIVYNQAITIEQISKGENQFKNVKISLPNAKLWTPDNPNLYVLELINGSNRYKTRFGMRSFEVDTMFTNRTLLNGKPCYIRGTNFAINRFYEDPLCFQQPWDKAWVRKLISSYRGMGMNGVRFSISSAPEIWYDIADEEGLMIFDEYPLWSAFQPEVGNVEEQAKHPQKKWGIVKTKITAKHIANEFTHWMQDRWNHPSVIVWDAQNETWTRETAKAINMVRALDLSNRPWDNGWSPPASKSDLREAHPYFEAYVTGTEQQNDRKVPVKPFTLDKVLDQPKVPSTFYLPYQYVYKELPLNWYWQQAVVNNEYSYLWLNRDGTPTTLTKNFYNAALGVNATANQRRELYAKYLAAVTEYWRSLRTCVALLYPFGINYSMPDGETSDNLIDVNEIKFDQFYLKYIPDAFSPLGVSIDFWETIIPLVEVNGTAKDIPIFITNDTDAHILNKLSLKLMQGNEMIKEIKTNYEVAAFQQNRVILRIDMPEKPGKYQLIAEIIDLSGKSIKSYREIELTK